MRRSAFHPADGRRRWREWSSMDPYCWPVCHAPLLLPLPSVARQVSSPLIRHPEGEDRYSGGSRPPPRRPATVPWRGATAEYEPSFLSAECRSRCGAPPRPWWPPVVPDRACGSVSRRQVAARRRPDVAPLLRSPGRTCSAPPQRSEGPPFLGNVACRNRGGASCDPAARLPRSQLAQQGAVRFFALTLT